MNVERNATFSGIAYSLPLLIWLLPMLQGSDDWPETHLILQEGMLTILLLQGLVISLFVPRLLTWTDWSRAVHGGLLLISPAWPLLTLIWLAGAANAAPLLLSQLVLLTFLLLLQGLVRLLQHHFPILSTAALQLILVSLLLTGYDHWLTEIRP
jgi:hypothetical protein